MKTTLFILSFFIVVSNVQCDSSKNISRNYGQYFSSVDSLIITAIEDSTFPGAVLLVWQEGETLYKKGYGRFTYDDTSSAVTTETRLII